MEKAYDDQGIRDFDLRIKQFLADFSGLEYTVEPKIDGLAVELIYKKGQFTQASTGGDGMTAEDITPNIKTILSVPLTLRKPLDGRPIPDLLEVKGDVYMERAAFETLNRRRIRKNEPPFANPKNAATVSIRQCNARVTAKRPLDMFCHGIGDFRGPVLDSHYGLMVYLQELGFRVNRPFIRVCETVDEVIESCHQLEDNRDRFPFEMDGALIQINPLKHRSKLGRKTGSPGCDIVFNFGNSQTP